MTTAPVDLKHTAPFVADWTALDGQLNGAQPGFVKALRRAGIERFQALGFPTPRQEAWRLTNVAPIAGTPFSLPAAPAGIGPADIQPYVYDGCARLVFLDGHFAPALSSTEGSRRASRPAASPTPCEPSRRWSRRTSAGTPASTTRSWRSTRRSCATGRSSTCRAAPWPKRRSWCSSPPRRPTGRP